MGVGDILQPDVLVFTDVVSGILGAPKSRLIQLYSCFLGNGAGDILQPNVLAFTDVSLGWSGDILQLDVRAFTDVSLGWSGDILQLDVLAFTDVSWGWESRTSFSLMSWLSLMFLGKWSR